MVPNRPLPPQVYTPEKVRAVLATLAEEAPLMMLFLKSVERLEVLDWAPGEPAPVLVFECCVQVRTWRDSGVKLLCHFSTTTKMNFLTKGSIEGSELLWVLTRNHFSEDDLTVAASVPLRVGKPHVLTWGSPPSEKLQPQCLVWYAHQYHRLVVSCRDCHLRV